MRARCPRRTSSVAAYDGQIGQAAYAATKGGVAALTSPPPENSPSTHPRGLIAPGLFDTPHRVAAPPRGRSEP
ncbi:hypothetical protein OG252_44495 [Streptomyces sp. NBC_01352]|uniref:hypothetical protein n=1 Tax=Streptomyces sp. NBC_01352 TaxID=2903834 RepID=UPI002E34B172|nr:hypothetical protein [Streptomyces sp. NBC_01352]